MTLFCLDSCRQGAGAAGSRPHSSARCRSARGSAASPHKALGRPRSGRNLRPKAAPAARAPCPSQLEPRGHAFDPRLNSIKSRTRLTKGLLPFTPSSSASCCASSSESFTLGSSVYASIAGILAASGAERHTWRPAPRFPHAPGPRVEHQEAN